MPEYKHLAHVTSFSRQPLVFLTVVTHRRQPCLACKTAFETLSDIWTGSPALDDWSVGDFLLMPDHLHLFARPAFEAKPLNQWVETWKSLSSRELKTKLALQPPLWQRDYFDRFLRSADNYSTKWDYVALNPVRRKLCAHPNDWAWKGRLTVLRY